MYQFISSNAFHFAIVVINLFIKLLCSWFIMEYISIGLHLLSNLYINIFCAVVTQSGDEASCLTSSFRRSVKKLTVVLYRCHSNNALNSFSFYNFWRGVCHAPVSYPLHLFLHFSDLMSKKLVKTKDHFDSIIPDICSSSSLYHMVYWMRFRLSWMYWSCNALMICCMYSIKNTNRVWYFNLK